MRRYLVGLTVAVSLVGCASLPPQKPITADSVAGTWSGVAYFSGGSDNIQVTINRDGTFTGSGSRGASSGVYKIIDGRAEATNNTTGAVSTWKLYGEGADRVLIASGKTAGGQNYETQLKPVR